MNIIDTYLPYWPLFASCALFLALGLWWRLAAARAMEGTPKSAAWVRSYRTGGFPFRRELLGSPRLCWWALLLTLVLGAAFAAFRFVNTWSLYTQEPLRLLGGRYSILMILLCALGAGAVFCLLQLLFGSPWTALPGALLFAASPVRSHGIACLLAVSLLLLVLYLRAEKPGFPAELLYLCAVLSLSPLVALRSAMLWVLPCFPLLHWYKLRAHRRARQLSGGKLLAALLAALPVWALSVLLTPILYRFLMLGFGVRTLLGSLTPERYLRFCRELWQIILSQLLSRPTRGMTICLMLDAPLLGFGLWGCVSAWVSARKRRSVRGVFSLGVLAVLLLVWLLTGTYVLSLGLTLTAACVLHDAELAKKRWIPLSMTLTGVCWCLLLHVAAWYLPLVPGIIERMA